MYQDDFTLDRWTMEFTNPTATNGRSIEYWMHQGLDKGAVSISAVTLERAVVNGVQGYNASWFGSDFNEHPVFVPTGRASVFVTETHTAAGHVAFYVDGVLVLEFDGGQPIGQFIWAPTYAPGSQDDTHGTRLDEVAVFDRTLTSAEISSHFAAGVGPDGWAEPCNS